VGRVAGGVAENGGEGDMINAARAYLKLPPRFRGQGGHVLPAACAWCASAYLNQTREGLQPALCPRGLKRNWPAN
jgi:hypothetical protein